MFRSVFYKLSINQRYFVRRIFYFPIDFINFLLGKNKNKLVPPKGKIFTGSGDFYVEGKEHVRFLKTFANLKPNATVLDIGSGIGRTAVGLTHYLNKEGKYFGFDVVPAGVDWCKKNITAKFPNFHFDLIDVHNDLYRFSKEKATNLRFKYPDNTFDVVFLFSVFTHMELHEIDHYLKEIYRVLKPNSYCLATFFLYENAKEAMHNNSFKFPFEYSNYRLMNTKVKGANIALSQNYLLQLTQQIGFTNKNLVKGYWSQCYPKKDNNFQDIVVLQK